ncbi:MAG: hypothetical protein GEU96_13690 [Propionibacteriales bacterium]|nr:hypothetical protein [Propionibacteriales bacterium]
MSHEQTRDRLVAVAGAVAAALAVWVVADPIAGVDLRAPAGSGGQTHDVNAVTVIIPSLVGALAGWGLLALLERWTSRARRIWVTVAVVALVLSLGAPLSASGITDENKGWLAVMHLAVAAALIPLLARTAAPRAALRQDGSTKGTSRA